MTGRFCPHQLSGHGDAPSIEQVNAGTRSISPPQLYVSHGRQRASLTCGAMTGRGCWAGGNERKSASSTPKLGACRARKRASRAERCVHGRSSSCKKNIGNLHSAALCCLRPNPRSAATIATTTTTTTTTTAAVVCSKGHQRPVLTLPRVFPTPFRLHCPNLIPRFPHPHDTRNRRSATSDQLLARKGSERV
jgi:hypothetical protein